MDDRGLSVIEQKFFILLRAGLWQKNNEIAELVSLSSQDWEEIYRIAQKQTVLGILYDSFVFLDKALLPPKLLLMKWTVYVDQLERLHSKVNQAIEGLYQFFGQHNITPLLLKGQVTASFYPNPSHRSVGDIDFTFRDKKDFLAAEVCLKQHQIPYVKTAGFSLTYFWEGIEVEHHLYGVDLYNPLIQGRIQKWIRQEGFSSYKLSASETIMTTSFSPLLFVLQSNAHILKHCLSFGIGLRQLCDAAILMKTYEHVLLDYPVKTVYKNLHVEKWMNLLEQFCEDYLGLEWGNKRTSVVSQKDEEWLLKLVMQYGNFGFYDPNSIQPNQSKSRDPVEKIRILKNLFFHFTYVPLEVIGFPLAQVYSRLWIISKT